MEIIFTLSLLSVIIWTGIFLFAVAIFETDFFFALVAAIIGALGLLCYHKGYNPFLWSYNNIDIILTYIAVYLFIGIIWSFPAFFLSVRKEIKRQKANDYNVKHIYFEPHYWKVTNYILFWPISMVSAFLTDIIRDICELIAEYFKDVYKKIFDYQINKLNKEK